MRMRKSSFLSIIYATILALFMSIGGVAALRAEDGVFEPLSIATAGGKHDFQVEVMRSEDEQRRGMMFRRSLDADKGMLFPFPAERIASFWMENTYVSLDMIFIRSDGTIQRIEKRAEPLSTRTIMSGAPVLAVLEVVAGTADKLGIKPGDKVSYPIFKP
ncbi:hypothetical protein C5L14_23875 [Labrys okinawensis]|uniref:DUF192 domain-containing protein n=1 Tax=Labrys okinawensis TaxID=346911 RepID=A0A2S9Q6M8_9HYPH|nr:DUF192 domain-containing protein [Labrys okinawensis]PRH84995.1 hypothetical protein C5L14_23875 [Labrys okinawensis]